MTVEVDSILKSVPIKQEIVDAEQKPPILLGLPADAAASYGQAAHALIQSLFTYIFIVP